jgi:hypothetical protein
MAAHETAGAGAGHAWNGRHVRLPGSADHYVIDYGYRRRVPDARVAERLFPGLTIEDDGETRELPEGSPLPDVAALVKARETGRVYLIDVDPRPGRGTQRVRREVAGPETAKKYRLRDLGDPSIPVAPQSVLGDIRLGPAVR